MFALSSNLQSRCRKCLLDCDKFASLESLKTIFAVKELVDYRHLLPLNANDQEDLVDKVLSTLIRKETSDHQSLFLVFLETLRGYIHTEDRLYAEISQLYHDVAYVYSEYLAERKYTDLHSRGPAAATYIHRQELLSILTKRESWPDDVLRKAYRLSVPDSWPWLGIPNQLSLMVEELAKMRLHNDKIFPLLEFVQHLANYAGQHQEFFIQDALNHWIDERWEEQGFSSRERAALYTKVQKQVITEQYYLLIVLEEVHEDAFQIQAWLLDSRYDPTRYIYTGATDEPIALENISELLSKVIGECEEYLCEGGDIIIEFILPDKLLSHPMDQYFITDSSGWKHKLGLQYPVIIRSLRRMRTKQIQRNWRNKWNALQGAIAPSISNDGFMWICGEEHCEPPESFQAFLSESSAVCFTFAFTLSGEDISHNQILNAILGMGIPIAIWSRKQTDYPTSIQNLFSSFQEPQKLFSLPAFVKEQRIAAAKSKNEQHLGYHLTLLLDDPDKLPSIIPLATARTRRGA